MIVISCLVAAHFMGRRPLNFSNQDHLINVLGGQIGNQIPDEIADAGGANGIRVIRYSQLQKPGFHFLPASQSVIVLHAPAETQWSKSRNQYVPQLEALIKQMMTQSQSQSLLLIIPPRRMDMSRSWYQDQYLPLTHQAARETGAKIMQASSSSTKLRVQIDDRFTNWKHYLHGWKVVGYDSYEKGEGNPKYAIDGDPDTYWHTQYSPTATPYPHFIEVDTGSVQQFLGFRYLPRQDGGVNGDVALFNLEISPDGTHWTTVLQNQPVKGSLESVFAFPKPIYARYYKFVALKEQNKGPWASAAELDMIP